jgi:hypothetical protein
MHQLREITPDNFDEGIRLELKDEQKSTKPHCYSQQCGFLVMNCLFQY